MLPASPTPSSARRRRNCSAKFNVFFLKTHKCASSTVQNVLMRYGRRRRLSFVLPTLGNYLGNQAPFHRTMAAVAPWHAMGYNMFCHHTVFQQEEVAAVMPSDTVYVSIVRHPVSLFESLYSYAHLEMHYRQTLQEFAASRAPAPPPTSARQLPSDVHSNDDSSAATAAADKVNVDRSFGYLGVNQMAYDMGIRPADMSNRTLVRQRLRMLDRRFGLVLLAEYFDESMVLLADFLCWSLEDVTYFRHNARRSLAKRRLTPETARQLEALNEVDLYIYRHFESKFLARVAEYGHRKMKERVKELKRLNAQLLTYCTHDNAAGSSSSSNSNGSTVVTIPPPPPPPPPPPSAAAAASVTAAAFPTFASAGSTARGKSIFRSFTDDVVSLSVAAGRRHNQTCTDMTITELAFTDRLKMAQMMRALQVLRMPADRIRFVSANGAALPSSSGSRPSPIRPASVGFN